MTSVKREIDIGECAYHVPEVLAATRIAPKCSYSYPWIIIGLLPAGAAIGLPAYIDLAECRPGIAEQNGLGLVGDKKTFMVFKFCRKRPAMGWDRILGAGDKE